MHEKFKQSEYVKGKYLHLNQSLSIFQSEKGKFIKRKFLSITVTWKYNSYITSQTYRIAALRLYGS